MKILIKNKKAFHDYTVIDCYEAGIVLTGAEVKALRSGQGSFTDAYAHYAGGTFMLGGLFVPHYKYASKDGLYEENRPRTLLLHKHEVRKLNGAIKRQGQTLIPTKLYLSSKSLIKVELALSKGKTLSDKREALKQRSWQREKQQLLKQSRNYRKD